MTLLIACLCLAIWLYMLFLHGSFWRTDTLESVQSAPPAQWPDVSVIIPARNEADILSDALPTLINHDYPDLRIVLVDDRSEDGTAEMANHIARQTGGRLEVISGKPRAGWKGKIAAMQSGLDHIAESDRCPRYILFTDADIRYDLCVLKALVAKAEAGNLVLTSLMVRLRCQSTAERCLVPAFVYFFQMLYPFRHVNDPRNRTAAAAGGCMLVRYDALEKVGSLELIRQALIDDCALGKLMKPLGPVWLGLTEHVHSIRPYPRIGDIHAMVSRSAYDQLGYSLMNLAVTVLGLLLTFVAPVLLTLFASGAPRLLGALSWLCMGISFLPMLRFYGRSSIYCILLPAIAAAYLAFTIDSAFQFLKGTGGQWKGRMQATGPGA